MISKCLGTLTLKVLVGNPAPLPGTPAAAISYFGVHGPYACAAAGGSFLAPRLQGLPSIFVPQASDIVVSGAVFDTTNPPPIPFIKSPYSAYTGQMALGIGYDSGTNDYAFQALLLGAPITSAPSLSDMIDYPGSSYNSPSTVCGWASFNGPVVNGIAVNAFNNAFYQFNNTGYSLLPGTVGLSEQSGFTFATKDILYFGNLGVSYTDSTYYIGDLIGTTDIFLFDDPELNNTLPVNITSQGLGYGLSLEDASGAFHFVLLSFDGSHYIKLNFDLSGVPSNLANGVGQKFFAAADGLVYYIDDAQGVVNTSGTWTFTPLYASPLLAMPPPFNFAFAQRALISPHCCPTGDGHR